MQPPPLPPPPPKKKKRRRKNRKDEKHLLIGSERVDDTYVTDTESKEVMFIAE